MTMVSKAIARFIRISPRKTRLVANAVKGKDISEALAILSNTNKRASGVIEDVLRSAINNAKRHQDIDQNSLFISKLLVDGGPALKRFRAASMGRAAMIKHRTSHITVELDTRPQKIKAAPAKAPTKKTGILKKRSK
jgi:large subunit ribosomal protein L22